MIERHEATGLAVWRCGGVACLLPGSSCARRSDVDWPPPRIRQLQFRVLRWKQFIQAEFDAFVANTKKISEKTGVKVRVDAEKLGTTSDRNPRSRPMLT